MVTVPGPAFCPFEINGIFFFFLPPESTMEMQIITKTIYTICELKIFLLVTSLCVGICMRVLVPLEVPGSPGT